MKIYIAGKIAGDPNYKEKFTAAENGLKERGHVVLNPAMLPKGLKNQDYMSICKSMIDAVDMILLLGDYKKSRGAMLEIRYAKYTGKGVRLISDGWEIEISRRQREAVNEG